jgi:quercetin dioxygenase-like cupin family protein
MVVKSIGEVTPAAVQENDIEAVTMRVVISEQDGAPNYIMRVFEVGPGGHTAYHTHKWEHEVYVLEGTGVVKQGDREHPVEKDSIILVVPNEEHQFINTGPGAFKFICVVPITRSD